MEPPLIILPEIVAEFEHRSSAVRKTSRLFRSANRERGLLGDFTGNATNQDLSLRCRRQSDTPKSSILEHTFGASRKWHALYCGG